MVGGAAVMHLAPKFAAQWSNLKAASGRLSWHHDCDKMIVASPALGGRRPWRGPAKKQKGKHCASSSCVLNEPRRSSSALGRMEAAVVVVAPWKDCRLRGSVPFTAAFREE